MRSRAWLGGWGLALVALSCDPGLSLQDALEGKRCGTTEPQCLGVYVCDVERQVCVLPEDVRLPEMVARSGDSPPANASGAGGSETGLDAMSTAIADVGRATMSAAVPDVVPDAGMDMLSSAVPDAGMDTLSADVPDAADAAPPCVPRLLFRDRDGDGFGSDVEQQVLCPSPGWASQGGDCLDDPAAEHAAEVHRGQTQYFAVGYPIPGRPGQVSFDYDCSTSEDADPANRAPSQRAGDCATTNPSNCGRSIGRQTTDRTGAGVDDRCGSNSLVICGNLVAGLQCTPVAQAFDVFRCR